MENFKRKVIWLLKRWMIMEHPIEELYRLTQLVKSNFLFKYFPPHLPETEALLSPRVKVIYSKEKISDYLKQKDLLHYNILGNKQINVSDIKNWNYDYFNQKDCANKYYTKYEKQNFEKHGDIKYLADISRFHFLPFLAFKSALNEEFTSIISEILVQWSTQNTYLNSINWTSGIEVAIRAINFTYTYLILHQHHDDADHALKILSNQIHYHLHYLENHLSKYSSANNHYLAEISGITIIHCAFQIKEKSCLKKWVARYFSEIKRQINADGVHFELSTRYHVEMLDHITNTVLFITRNKIQIDDHIKKRLKKAYLFNHFNLESESNNTGFGDSDNGFLLYPYFDYSFDLYHSLNVTKNILSGTETEKDCRNYLMFGDDNISFLNPIDSLPTEQLFLNSGFYFNYSRVLQVTYFFGNLGDSITAAHGHSDIFHFSITVNNKPFLIDSGTFQYHTRFHEIRQYFRGVKAHNTISIDGLDQGKQHNRMSWIKMPNTEVEEINNDSNKISITASHDGFKNQNSDIHHSRTFQFNKKAKSVKILDRLHGDQQTHICEFYLQIHPEVNCQLLDDQLTLSNNVNKLVIRNSKFDRARLINTHYSNKYDNISSKKTLILRVEFSKELKMTTSINLTTNA